ncbi:MAG: septum formation initiator family protein [Aeromicrobium sp.]|uniref:FtsB family cell division protein n=1 Tax=Aeromicrobium sp. TaxID=1871063 RepID=UPI0039E649D7
MALVLVGVLLFLSYTASLRTWWQQRQEIRAAEAEIAMREDAIADLAEEAERWEDPAFVEQQARERFGWVMPGEVGYRVIGSDGEVQGDVPQLTEPPSDEPPQWYDQLWSSVALAGQPESESDSEPEKPAETEPTAPLQDSGG